MGKNRNLTVRQQEFNNIYQQYYWSKSQILGKRSPNNFVFLGPREPLFVVKNEIIFIHVLFNLLHLQILLQNVEATFLVRTTESFIVPITLKSTPQVLKVAPYSAIGLSMFRPAIKQCSTLKHLKWKENPVVSKSMEY